MVGRWLASQPEFALREADDASAFRTMLGPARCTCFRVRIGEWSRSTDGFVERISLMAWRRKDLNSIKTCVVAEYYRALLCLLTA
jgi:hypothetical protein